MSIWDCLCVHACFHDWNPIGWILKDDWVVEVWQQYKFKYPGWKALRRG